MAFAARPPTRSLAWLSLLLCVVAAGCGDDDDVRAAGASVGASTYEVVVSQPRFVVPAANLPPQVEPQPSNNNVDIAFHASRLFMAWRTAPTHFASTDTAMHVVSSPNRGQTWEYETTIRLGSDVREPRLLSFGGRLQLLFFQGGTNPSKFEPQRMLRVRRVGAGEWSPVEAVADVGEIPWDLKVHNGLAYRTSYLGEHNPTGDIGNISVYFKSSSDGDTWTEVGGKPFVYRGGISEAAFEFDTDGSMWIVARNEDGDDTGFGSLLCRAPANALADWECPARSDPERYDSPEMFRHGDAIYLVARRDVGGPFDEGDESLSFAERKVRYLIDYSLRPKRTALYRIDKDRRAVVHVVDLPGAGDTAFASVQKTGPHSFLVANYTSPLDDPDISWLEGQTSRRGTQLYFVDLEFVPSDAAGSPTPSATTPVVPTRAPTPPGSEDALRPVLEPVFASPNVALSIAWPAVAGLTGILDAGDGSVLGPDSTSHVYDQGGGIFAVGVSVRSTDGARTYGGAVARTALRAAAGLRRFRLTEPQDAVAQSVISGVIPAFYWAADGERLAVASDPTGKGKFSFTDVRVTAAPISADGTLDSSPFDLRVELSGPRATPSGAFVGLTDVVFHGVVADAVFASKLRMDARIVVRDLVAVLGRLAAFEEADALRFLAGLFGFDAANPPETAAFRGEFTVQPAS